MERNNSMNNQISGVLVVDKPVGLTSHDVVQIIRNGTNIRRAGHTGTLDPRASGVLVVLLGPAVRLSEYVSASDKRYQAVLRLGTRTDLMMLRTVLESPSISQKNSSKNRFQNLWAKLSRWNRLIPPSKCKAGAL